MSAAFRRAYDALRELADELDASGCRPLGTSVLNEARELIARQALAVERANDNQGDGLWRSIG